MRLGSTFSGCGGLDIGLSRALGATVAWHAEVDRDANKVLVHRWPGVPNLGDVGAVDWSQVEPVDVLCGGPPCQSVSSAGKRKGEADERWQWPAFLRAVRDARPRWVVAENPSALLGFDHGRAFGAILAELAEAGYDTWWRCLRASDVGAPHRRERVFLVGALADAERYVLARTGPGDVPRAAGGTCCEARQQRVRAVAGHGDCAAADDQPGSQGPEPAGRRLVPAWCGATPADAAGYPWWFSDGDGAAPAEPESIGWRQGRAREHDGLGTAFGGEVDWGVYAPAIERWERLFRPAPAPVDGRGRLSPRFVEWMMGCPDGWVDVPGVSRNAQLRILGNSVVVPVAEAVGHWLASLMREREPMPA